MKINSSIVSQLGSFLPSLPTPEGIDIDAKDLHPQEEYKKYLENERYQHDTNARKWLAEWAATVVSLWLGFVVIALIANGQHFLHLTDTTLSVLLGTTTLNILGLMFIVLRGYFDSKKE